MHQHSTETREVEGYWAFRNRVAPALVGVAGQGEEGGGGGERRSRRPAPPSPYLETEGNTVTGEERQESECIEVRSKGCGSWYCERCCLGKGLRLKERLIPRLDLFTGVMMLTFTVDPELFDSPAAALAYVTRRRCIAVTLQRLHRWGLIHSRRFFAVIEWQRNGWPHWHVAVDASRIPFEKLCEAWNRNWQGWRDRLACGRPGFGSVRFSSAKGKMTVKHAVSYMVAYLCKPPKHGYPQWVLESRHTIRRYSTSRAFWGDEEGQDGAEEAGSACDEPERPEEPEEEGGEDVPGQEEERDGRTIAERLERCGSECVVCAVREGMDEKTGEVVLLRRFIMRIPVRIGEVLDLGTIKVNKRQTAALFDWSGLRRVTDLVRMKGGVVYAALAG